IEGHYFHQRSDALHNHKRAFAQGRLCPLGCLHQKIFNINSRKHWPLANCLSAFLLFAPLVLCFSSFDVVSASVFVRYLREKPCFLRFLMQLFQQGLLPTRSHTFHTVCASFEQPCHRLLRVSPGQSPLCLLAFQAQHQRRASLRMRLLPHHHQNRLRV